MHDTFPLLRATAFPSLRRRGLATLQVNLISVDRQGDLYVCDFNQQLGLSMHGKGGSGGRRHLCDLLAEDFSGASIAVADHCYGCAAGQGSSCGGALDETQVERAA